MMTRRFDYRARHGTARLCNPACRSGCAEKSQLYRRYRTTIKRWADEEIIEAMQTRLDRMPAAMRVRREAVEHVFGTLRDWMGRSHFKMRRLENVETEIDLYIAYNIKRVIALVGVPGLMEAMRE